MQFKVKICGVRLKSEVHAVRDAGADAVGFNFFPPSIRFIDPDDDQTHQLSGVAEDQGLIRVGVFVNETARRVSEVAKRVGLDVIQLHGDEPVTLVDQLRQTFSPPIIRAIKLPTGQLSPSEIARRCQPWLDVGCDLLLDADAGVAHGGSGKTLDWKSLADWSAEQNLTTWTLAGGLTPDNVTTAIRTSGTTSVDTASGAEEPRGKKSPEKIHQFTQAALAALA